MFPPRLFIRGPSSIHTSQQVSFQDALSVGGTLNGRQGSQTTLQSGASADTLAIDWDGRHSARQLPSFSLSVSLALPGVSISNGLFRRLQRSLAHPLHYVHAILYISRAVLVFVLQRVFFLFCSGFSLVFRLADDRTVVHLFRACSVISISAYLVFFCVFYHRFRFRFRSRAPNGRSTYQSDSLMIHF